MPKQKFYIIIKADGDDFSVALPTDNMFSIYCYLDKLVQSGKTWKAHFEPEEAVRERFSRIDDNLDLGR